MKAAYISIGSNMGNKVENLRKALVLTDSAENIRLTKISSFYETEPWGRQNQPHFLNATAEILTGLSPENLLKTLLNIENIMGRVRKEHWGERIIDIDIIHYEGENIKSENLTLPHPYFSERNFVLIPLFEIEPKLVINDISIKKYLKKSKDNLKVTKAKGSPKDFDMTLIAAVDKNRGIGFENKILYTIKSDLKYFRQNTLNSIIIMGKNTFHETGVLDERKIIVMTKTENFDGKIYSVKSVLDLFNLLDNFNSEKIFIAGGEAVYDCLLPYANTALVTHILSEKKADKFFPVLYDFKLQEMRFSEEQGAKFAFSKYVKEYKNA